MGKKIKAEFWELSLADLKPALLKNFNRHQETTRAWQKSDDGYIINEISFIDDWSDRKKEQVIRSLKRCLKSGGIVVGAFLNDTLIGFANVENDFFGSNQQYLEMNYIHVTKQYRGQGIGQELFQLCCHKAKLNGAKKLYIGAHPSVKTQKFYKRQGCVYAEEINPKILKREPLDIQLECPLY